MVLKHKRTHADRKPAGASLLSRIRIPGREGRTGRHVLGAIGGFGIGMEVQRLGREAGAGAVSVWLDRTGDEQAVEITEDLTPLGLVSRLENMLDRFEADLAEHRRRLAEAEQRLPAYRDRRGEVFAFEGELREKEEELRSLEAALASGEPPGQEGDEAGDQARAA